MQRSHSHSCGVSEAGEGKAVVLHSSSHSCLNTTSACFCCSLYEIFLGFVSGGGGGLCSKNIVFVSPPLILARANMLIYKKAHLTQIGKRHRGADERGDGGKSRKDIEHSRPSTSSTSSTTCARGRSNKGHSLPAPAIALFTNVMISISICFE